MDKPRVYRLVDLFSGAGGLTLGFYNTGRFRSVFAVEFDGAAAETYAENFEHGILSVQEGPVDVSEEGLVFHGDIRKLGTIGLPADVVIGGPPCQGFSPLGKIAPRKEHLSMNQLWQEYMRVVHQVRPLAFVIENVPEILKSREYIAIERVARRLGYTTEAGLLKAVEFGVPQRRVRAFIIGFLGGVKPRLPVPTGDRKTVRDEIGDLPLHPTTYDVITLPDRERGRRRQDLHIGRRPTQKSIERYRVIKEGENRFALMRRRPDLTPRCWLNKLTGSTDVFGRLRWDDYAYTIRTEFYKPEKGCYLHPQADRPITHREAARLQTFDDWFFFKGSKIQIARQIGNAVPPRLAQAVAEQVVSQLPEVEQAVSETKSVPCVDFHTVLGEVLDAVYGSESEVKRIHQAKLDLMSPEIMVKDGAQ